MQKVERYGAQYYTAADRGAVIMSQPNALYHFRAYHGALEFNLEYGDCAFILRRLHSRGLHGMVEVERARGYDHKIQSEEFACVIRGYAPDEGKRTLINGMLLPYVNGCATKQLFPPDRPGDPTWQQLIIPPHTSEQAHHIHSTPRVVYVLAGCGRSVVGMGDDTTETELLPGMTCILAPMCPHHFVTGDEPLNVLPVHVWSSTPSEWNHPMFLGTHMTNQGE